MGGIVKAAGSLFGGRKRRRTERAAQKELTGAENQYKDFKFSNAYEGLQGASYDPASVQAATAQAATLGPAAQAELGTLADAQGYEAQGYDAAQAEAAQAAKTNLGEDTGRTNQFANLQVNTAAADLQGAQTDEALAAALESGGITGAGGATALAQQAARSKQGISADIAQQEAQNQQLRAQGATSVQQENLAQRNLARQANIQQDQFNTGLTQQTNLANQAATNQAAQFGAAAQNQAAQFGAQAQNQFALSSFNAQNQLNQFNAGAKNQFAQAQFNADNQFALANQQAQNQANQFNAQSANQAAQFGAQSNFQAAQLQAQGADQVQQREFSRQQDLLNIAAGKKAAATQARQQAKNDLVGGLASAANTGVSFLTGGLGGGK